jgi:hypothetical protein
MRTRLLYAFMAIILAVTLSVLAREAHAQGQPNRRLGNVVVTNNANAAGECPVTTGPNTAIWQPCSGGGGGGTSVSGTVTLSNGSGTFINPAIAATSICEAIDLTTFGNAVDLGPPATGSEPLSNGTGTDQIRVICYQTGGSTCSGVATLSAGSGTFTSSCIASTSICKAMDLTNFANAVDLGQPSGGSVALSNGTGSDQIEVLCNIGSGGVTGTATLSAGSGTLTASGIMASSICEAMDLTTFTNAVDLGPPSTNSEPLSNGTGSDQIEVECN